VKVLFLVYVVVAVVVLAVVVLAVVVLVDKLIAVVANVGCRIVGVVIMNISRAMTTRPLSVIQHLRPLHNRSLLFNILC
jgi:hypothetical protein